jgi:hypothetical protein
MENPTIRAMYVPRREIRHWLKTVIGLMDSIRSEEDCQQAIEEFEHKLVVAMALGVTVAQKPMSFYTLRAADIISVPPGPMSMMKIRWMKSQAAQISREGGYEKTHVPV